MITFDNVSKSYRTSTRPALQNISAEIEKGEFVFLIGPSGSGKSTFLQLMVRDEALDSGDLHVAGFHVNALKDKEVPKLRQRIGYVFQDFRLLQKKTVFENVAFALEVIGKKRPDIEKLVPAALETVGLQGKENRFPHELSGGEQQRVAIARALAKNPKLLLCDEPTGALDYNTGKAVLKLLQDTCRQSGVTVIVITHNQAITAMADRIITVKNGTIVSEVLNDHIVPVEQIEW